MATRTTPNEGKATARRPNKPSAAPNKPSAAPNKPSAAPKKPSAAPNKPSAAPNKPSEQRPRQPAAVVSSFLRSVEPEDRRKDALQLLSLMKRATGERAKLWGSSIVGFGQYHYKYDSGREGDSMMVGFSPRRQCLVVYIMPGFEEAGAALQKLGKHKVGKSCLYIKKLAEVDLEVLEELIVQSYQEMQRRYPEGSA